MTVQARLSLNEYTARLLDMVKAKFGLKNRSDALNRLALEVGSEYIEPQVNEDVLIELDRVYDDHIKKYGFRGMTEKELDKLLGLD